MDRDRAPRGVGVGRVGEGRSLGTGGAAASSDAVASDVTSHTVTPTHTAASGKAFGLPEPTTLTWQDLIDLPGQILPPQTVHHLRNAGREAMLAVYSLWRSVRKATEGTPEQKVRKHIEVE